MHFECLIVAVLTLAWSQPARGSATLDLPAYQARLDAVIAAVSSASTATEAQATAAALPDRLWVTSGDQVIVVDTRWLDEVVGSTPREDGRWPAVREEIHQRLTTMRSVASLDVASPERPARDVLQAVLARPEFQRGSTSLWLKSVRKRVGEWILNLLSRFTPSGVTGAAAAMAFAWVVSIGALLTFALWLVTWLLRRSDATWLSAGAAAPAEVTARQWAQRAVDAALSGHYRDAVRWAYHASVRRLEEQGAWIMDEARTPREYLLLLGSNDPRYTVLRDVTRRFEQVRYGRRAATMEDAQELSLHLERLGCLQGPDRPIVRF